MSKWTISVLMGFILTTQTSLAQDGKIPKLGQHIFVPTEFTQSPFINTLFSTSLGGGSSIQQDFPSVDLGNGEIVGLNGTIVYLGLGFQYRSRLKDWIAFETRINVNGRIGSDLLSLISQGFSTVNQFDLGWLIRLYQNERFVVSGTAGVSSARGNFINLSGFVRDAIAGDTTAQLSRKVSITTGGLGYRLAWSASPLLGFSSTGNLYYGETFEGGRLYFLTRFTATLDANFRSSYGIPLGIAYGIDLNGLPEFVYVNNRTAVLQNLRVAWMGSDDFSLGLEATFGFLPVSGFAQKVKATTFSITSQYFFR